MLGSRIRKQAELSFDDMDSIVTQGKELGVYFYMMTGGEPMVRRKTSSNSAENTMTVYSLHIQMEHWLMKHSANRCRKLETCFLP